jgi:UDP-glucose 4-epimerase
MKHILVTGGFGFIGGHLIERLVNQPDTYVHVVDNLSTSPIPYQRLLDELGRPRNLTYDLISLRTYCMAMPHPEYDEIYHLASPVGPAGILQHAGQMVNEVVNDAYCLMELALECDAKLLDVSTSEIYGGGIDGRCAETMDKIVQGETTVRLEYAVAKLAAETAIINTCKVTPLRASIVRPFNVAGPRQNGEGGFVLPRFIDQAMRGEPLTVFGDGQQVRAFTHVGDIADGLMLIMQHGRNAEAYNLGNPSNKVSIISLAETVNQIVESDGGIIRVDPRIIFGNLYAEAAEKYPDARKSMDLGWYPLWGVARTIRSAYEYTKAHIAAPV